MAKITHKVFSSPQEVCEWLSKVSEVWNLNNMFCQVCKGWGDSTTVFYDERIAKDPSGSYYL